MRLEDLDRLIADELGPGEVFHRWSPEDGGGTVPQAMTAVIDEALRGSSRRVVIYWVPGGRPVNFSRPGFRPAAIAYNTRFVELAAMLFGVLRQGHAAEFVTAVSERLCLQLIAELAIRDGDPATATYLLLHSLFVDTNVYLAHHELEDLVRGGPSESWMAIWCYGLAHELGHVVAEDGHTISDDFLNRVVQLGLDGMGIAREQFDATNGELRQRGVRHSLELGHLRDEITADGIGTVALYHATAELCTAAGREFDPVAFSTVVMLMFDVMSVLNTAALATQTVTTLERDPADDPWRELSGRIRIEAMIENLTVVLHATTESDEPRTRMELFDYLSAAHHRYRHLVDALERGLRAASVLAREPGRRHLHLGADLLDRIRQEGLEGYFAEKDAERFLAIADALQTEHPDIDRLRQVVRSRTMPYRTLRYITPWLHSAEDDARGEAVFLDAGAYALALAFTEADDAYHAYRESLIEHLEPGWWIEDREIRSLWQHEIATIIVNSAPSDIQPHCRVVFDDTELFGRLARVSLQRAT